MDKKNLQNTTRTTLKTRGELGWSEQVSSSCSTSGIRRVTPVTNPVILVMDAERTRLWLRNWNKKHNLFILWLFGQQKYRFGLWYLTPLSTIFQLYRGGQFYWWRKPEYPEKITDLSQVNLHCISLQMVRMNIKTNIRTFRLTSHWYIFSTYLCTCYELNMLIYWFIFFQHYKLTEMNLKIYKFLQ